jgi:uncharacterized protein (TIGR01777 family)
MRVAIAGASGLVGQALVSHFSKDDIDTLRLVRGAEAGPGTALWDPAAGKLDAHVLTNCDAVVNLAGESVADGSWSAARKRRILDSRIQSTRTICEALGRMKHPPKVLVSASAIGYYGNQGTRWVEEEDPVGTGFLAEVCRQWEAEAVQAEQYGVRVVRLRIGIVLTTKGGALAKMLPPFRLGLGGPLGSGEQYMSWITLNDLVRTIRWCISRQDIRGAVNAVAPNPVTNREFTRTLASAVHRPAFFTAPAFVLRGVMGEMADEMLLGSTRVRPTVLKNEDFEYQHENLSDALSAILSGRE